MLTLISAFFTIEGVPLVGVTGPAALTFVALLVITDKLVWHTRLDKVRDERDKWQAIALQALGVSENVVSAAEVSNEIFTRLAEAAQRKQE